MLIHYYYWLLQKNVKEMMDVNGIKVLVDLLTLAHLHTTRAVVPFQVMCRFEKVFFFMQQDVVFLFVMLSVTGCG